MLRARRNLADREQPRVGGMKFPHDPDHPVDRLEVRSGNRAVHRGIGHEQRLIEAAHLKREELGRRPGHARVEDFPHEIAHPLRATPWRGDLGDGHAGVQEIDDPPLAVGLALTDSGGLKSTGPGGLAAVARWMSWKWEFSYRFLFIRNNSSSLL